MSAQATLSAMWGKPESKRPPPATVDPEAPTPSKRQATGEGIVDLTEEPVASPSVDKTPEQASSSKPAASPAKKGGGMWLGQAPGSNTKCPKSIGSGETKKSTNTNKKNTGGAGGKKGGSKNPSDAYKKVSLVGVHGAEYFDQCIGWTVLNDGRELLLGEEAWHIPEGFAASPNQHSPVKLGDIPGGYSKKFAAIEGLDLLASVTAISSGGGGGNGAEAGTYVTLYTLPDMAEAARLKITDSTNALRFHVESSGQRDDGLVLMVSDEHLILVKVQRQEGDSSSKPTINKLIKVDLDKAGKLTKFLGPKQAGGYGNLLVRSAALHVGPDGRPYALLGSQTNGSVMVVPLDIGQESASDVEVAKVIMAHGPMKGSRGAEKHISIVSQISVWRQDDGCVSVVTVGSDGHVTVTELLDGQGKWTDDRETLFVDQSWKCTGHGQMAFNLNVHSPSGVAFTGTQSEPCAFFWDLKTCKKLSKIAKIAEGYGHKPATLMVSGFSKSGLLAYSNSNRWEDDVLKVVVPSKK
jgi:hypothetical protein